MTAAFALESCARDEWMVTDLRLRRRSVKESTRNLLKTYAPSRAPSAIAPTAETFFAGREKVALELPASSRAAAPAALRRVSFSKLALCSPRPVNTKSRVVVPGILITSSALPVALISASRGRIFLESRAISPLSIEREFLPFLNESPTTKISSLMIPSVRWIVVISCSLVLTIKVY